MHMHNDGEHKKELWSIAAMVVLTGVRWLFSDVSVAEDVSSDRAEHIADTLDVDAVAPTLGGGVKLWSGEDIAGRMGQFEKREGLNSVEQLCLEEEWDGEGISKQGPDKLLDWAMV